MHSPHDQIRVSPLGSLLAVLVRQGIPFGGFLMLLAFAWAQYLSPWLEIRASQSWPEVECRPIHTAGQVGFRYAYEFEGQRFESDRLSLYESPPENLQEMQDKFRRGESVTGYVNPSDPGLAVLSRHDVNDETFGRIILGLFAVVFCSGVTAAWLTGMDKWTAAKAGREKKISPITRFCESVVYATLVNAFVCVIFVFSSIGSPPFLIKAFIYLVATPFTLLGLFMIYSVFRNFMLMFTENRR